MLCVRPFLPQLQQTFLKALTHDKSTRAVRLKAAVAISNLILVHTRCDPLFSEVHQTLKNATGDDTSVRETALYALRLSITAGGDKMSDQVSVTSDVAHERSPHRLIIANIRFRCASR